MQQRALATRRGAQALARVGAVHVDAENKQHRAAQQFQPEEVFFVIDKIHHERHAETCNEGIDNVAQRCTCTRGHTIGTAFLQRTLYAEYAHWSHGRRGYDAYKQPLEDEQQRTGKF